MGSCTSHSSSEPREGVGLIRRDRGGHPRGGAPSDPGARSVVGDAAPGPGEMIRHRQGITAFVPGFKPFEILRPHVVRTLGLQRGWRPGASTSGVADSCGGAQSRISLKVQRRPDSARVPSAKYLSELLRSPALLMARGDNQRLHVGATPMRTSMGGVGCGRPSRFRRGARWRVIHLFPIGRLTPYRSQSSFMTSARSRKSRAKPSRSSTTFVSIQGISLV